jgi:sugar phosphate permease
MADVKKDTELGTQGHEIAPKSGLAASMTPERRVQVEKSLKRKLDARCSLFVLIYIMNYLDRNNIAAARLGGLQEDLNINNTQYATCLSILYVGYICKSPPSPKNFSI